MTILVFSGGPPEELLPQANLVCERQRDGSYNVRKDGLGVCRTLEDLGQVGQAVKDHRRSYGENK